MVSNPLKFWFQNFKILGLFHLFLSIAYANSIWVVCGIFQLFQVIAPYDAFRQHFQQCFLVTFLAIFFFNDLDFNNIFSLIFVSFRDFLATHYFEMASNNPSNPKFCVKFVGKNYTSWEFQFLLFITRKELWAHISSTILEPIDATQLSQWKVKDVTLMSQIIASCDSHIVLNLHPYKIAKTI